MKNVLENYLEDYVNDLYEKQNIGVNKKQQGLYTKKDYFELLKPVIELVLKYKDYSIDELRTILYEKSNIKNNLIDFVYKKGMSPGLVFSYGTKSYRETILIGNKEEVSINEKGEIVPSLEEMTEDTIFDLASVTKIFTSLSILKLVENGIINLNDEIVKYATLLGKDEDLRKRIGVQARKTTVELIEGLNRKSQYAELYYNLKPALPCRIPLCYRFTYLLRCFRPLIRRILNWYPKVIIN